jgi:hypothetical protein
MDLVSWGDSKLSDRVGCALIPRVKVAHPLNQIIKELNPYGLGGAHGKEVYDVPANGKRGGILYRIDSAIA